MCVCVARRIAAIAPVVVAAAVSVAYVAVARVCVCACVCVSSSSLLDRAREATRDRATHSRDCARSQARWVAAVAAAVAPYVVGARMCVYAFCS